MTARLSLIHGTTGGHRPPLQFSARLRPLMGSGGKMKRIVFVLIAGITVFVLAAGHLWAQATAQITGTVRDQSGAVLPGVEVTVTQTDTGATRTAITNETGAYVLSNLPIGPYRLEAALPG